MTTVYDLLEVKNTEIEILKKVNANLLSALTLIANGNAIHSKETGMFNALKYEGIAAKAIRESKS